MVQIRVPQARRSPARPIIQPRSGEKFWWEQHGTCNPGVTEVGRTVVLLYRAYDNFYLSRFGYAESEDGVRFTRRDLPAVDTDPDGRVIGRAILPLREIPQLQKVVQHSGV